MAEDFEFIFSSIYVINKTSFKFLMKTFPGIIVLTLASISPILKLHIKKLAPYRPETYINVCKANPVYILYSHQQQASLS